jgi:hypothetical protein
MKVIDKLATRHNGTVWESILCCEMSATLGLKLIDDVRYYHKIIFA